MRLLKKVRAGELGIIAFLLPLCVRTIPELIAGPYPLGFDTVWFYAPFVRSTEVHGLASSLSGIISVRAAPFMFVLLGVVATLSNLDPLVITKAFGPVLFGLLVYSLYHFAKTGLGWNAKACLLVVLLSSAYFVPLRFSWDLYRNSLGYAFLIFALAYLRKSSVRQNSWQFLSFSGLVILTSEFASVLLGAICGLLCVLDILKERKPNLMLVAVVFCSILVSTFYLGLLIPPLPPKTPLATGSFVTLPIYNYVGSAGDVYNYHSLLDIYASVSLLTAIVFVPLFPLASLGFWRERRLATWTLALAAGAFSLLVVPFAAIPGWHRWLLMLVFPVMYFTVRGLSKLRWKLIAAFFGLILVLSVAFMVLPPDNALPYFTSSQTLPFVPSSMIQNSIPIQDSGDTVKAVVWLNGVQQSNSVIVTQISFQGWALLYSTNPNVYGFVDPSQVDRGNFTSYARVYLLYWAPQQGWFNGRLMPANMTEIYRIGRISVYQRVS